MSPEVFHVERSSSFIQVLCNKERIVTLSKARCASKLVLLHSFICGDHVNNRSSCMCFGHREWSHCIWETVRMKTRTIYNNSRRRQQQQQQMQAEHCSGTHKCFAKSLAMSCGDAASQGQA
eukprot:3249-Heterococcus_DN1.PRE.1